MLPVNTGFVIRVQSRPGNAKRRRHGCAGGCVAEIGYDSTDALASLFRSTSLNTVPQYEQDASGESSSGMNTRGCEFQSAESGAGQCIGNSSFVTSMTACGFEFFMFVVAN